MPYDLFISYSRRDNEQGRITQLVERIKAVFAPFAKRELLSFFDQQEIVGMQDWWQRILQGLREPHRCLLLHINADKEVLGFEMYVPDIRERRGFMPLIIPKNSHRFDNLKLHLIDPVEKNSIPAPDFRC